jgi:hypothetical protein
MYGNVDAAIQFFKTYRKHLMEKMGMHQSLADPCVFYKKNDKGRTILIAICFVDDTLLFGLKTEIEWYKVNVRKRFEYKDLGVLRKHLGVWYELKTDEFGNCYLEATMPKKIREIIKLYEKHIGNEAKIYAVPGTAGRCMERWTENALEHTMYRRLVGKIMFCVVKIFPEGTNAARELARHFSCPGPQQWEELGRFVGYLTLYSTILRPSPPPTALKPPFGIPARGMNGAPTDYYRQYFSVFSLGFPLDFGAKSFYIYVSY